MPQRIRGSEPQNHLAGVGGRLRWSVLWYLPDKDKIMRHPCGLDLGEALRVYNLAKNAGRSMVTLRCDNVGFPPPKKYQPHSVYVKRVQEYRTPKKRKLKKRVVREVVHVNPMDKANRLGIYWCPYCREMRRFQRQKGFAVDGIWVPDPNPKGGLYCPMCGASHRDFHVRRWNPIADRHYLTGK